MGGFWGLDLVMKILMCIIFITLFPRLKNGVTLNIFLDTNKAFLVFKNQTSQGFVHLGDHYFPVIFVLILE